MTGFFLLILTHLKVFKNQLISNNSNLKVLLKILCVEFLIINLCL